MFQSVQFLADRTNGRASTVALIVRPVVRLSVCRLSSVTLCIVAKQYVLRVGDDTIGVG